MGKLNSGPSAAQSIITYYSRYSTVHLPTMVKLAYLSLFLCSVSSAAFTVPAQSLLSSTSSGSLGGGGHRNRVRVFELADDGEVPESLKALLETPEIMELLKSEKMQEAMQLVMAGKRDELQERVQSDPEFQEIVEKLQEILGGGGGTQ